MMQLYLRVTEDRRKLTTSCVCLPSAGVALSFLRGPVLRIEELLATGCASYGLGDEYQDYELKPLYEQDGKHPWKERFLGCVSLQNVPYHKRQCDNR
jgi:hypothetical protein